MQFLQLKENTTHFPAQKKFSKDIFFLISIFVIDTFN